MSGPLHLFVKVNDLQFVVTVFCSEHLFHCGTELCVRLRAICISIMSHDRTRTAIRPSYWFGEGVKKHMQ